MKRKPREFNIFSLSFLDIITCGFGAIVLLVLISKYSPAPVSEVEERAEELLDRVLAVERTVDGLAEELSAARDDAASKATLLERLRAGLAAAEDKLRQREAEMAALEEDAAGLALVEKSLERATITPATSEERDEEVGGIPVDSDYVVFIVDTSGSMKAIWDRVTAEIENVIRIHPEIKGFQILNDNGAHIISAYEGKWIPDTPRRREAILKLFRGWESASNSSPVEGLEVALKRYAAPDRNVSIYIFGDDYSGSSYDPVINSLRSLNSNRVSGERLAKINAVGFISGHATNRFSILMREVTRQNGGTMLALPK